MNKWCITVGYPGGEIASRDVELLRPFFADMNRGPGDLLSRECPPDLAEWLDFGPMWTYKEHRTKVPGGYTYYQFSQSYGAEGVQERPALVFIPVQGAQNITVLEPA